MRVEMKCMQTRLTMTLKAAFGAIFVGAVLAGCGSMPEILTPTTAPLPAEDADLEATLGTLAPQRLKSGECGMFLWSRTPDRKLLLFSRSTERGAIVMLNDREQNIPRVTSEGPVVLGYNTQQSYVWRSLFLQVNVSFEQPPGIGRGAVISSGTIRMSRRDGWEYVVPVGGLLACES
jgi:hypothetical protein